MSSFLKILRVTFSSKIYVIYPRVRAVTSLAVFDTPTEYINFYLGLISLRLSASHFFLNMFNVSLKK